MRQRSSQFLAAAAAAAVLAVGSFGLSSGAAHAATGDTWSGYEVVDVTPAATTQTVLLGLMPHYTGGGKNLYLWNAVRMVKDQHGHESWVFCIQQAQAGGSPSYTEDPGQAGTPEARTHMDNINRILADSHLTAPGALEVTAPDPAQASPSQDVLPQNKNDQLEATAVQLAIWHYSDTFDFTASNTSIAETFYPQAFAGTGGDVTIGEIITRYNALVADAEANPLSNPVPAITVTPKTAKDATGTALFFTVKGTDIDGGITVTTDPASIAAHPVTLAGNCDTATVLSTLPDAGGKVCVVSDVEADVTITANGKSAPTTTHALFAFGAQGVISTGPDSASDSATGTWVATEVSPTKTPNTTPTTTTEVSAVKAGTLPATGPGGVGTESSVALLAILAGAALMLATRRRNAEAVAVVAAPPIIDSPLDVPSVGPARSSGFGRRAMVGLGRALVDEALYGGPLSFRRRH